MVHSSPGFKLGPNDRTALHSRPFARRFAVGVGPGQDLAKRERPFRENAFLAHGGFHAEGRCLVDHISVQLTKISLLLGREICQRRSLRSGLSHAQCHEPGAAFFWPWPPVWRSRLVSGGAWYFYLVRGNRSSSR